MQENNQLTEQEKDQLLTLISNLNQHRGLNNIEESNNEIAYNYLDDISKIFLILKGLSVTSIRNKELSLQEYKNIFIYMKNLIIMDQRNIKYSDKNEILRKMIIILLEPNIEFIHYNNMSLMFLQLIKIIFDNDNELIKDSSNNENFFKIVLDKVNQNNYKKEDFLIIAKNSLMIYMYLFDTNLIKEKNFVDLIQKYVVPICDIIFSKTGLYIVPFVMYDTEFIIVLKYLYELLISCLKKMKRFFPSIKRKEISDNLLIKYGRYSLDLIKLIPNLKKDEIILNNILVFKKEYKEFNFMKSNVFLFLCFIVENSLSSVNNEINYDSLNIIYQILNLVVEAFKQILDNEKLFLNLRKIEDEEKDEEEEYFNILLYNMIYFLCKSIIKEPIKSEFNKNIQIFLLNVIFPLLVTMESEYKYMQKEPEKYCTYLNDLLYNLTLKNFRIAGFILIRKICDNFEDVTNFIFSYIIGMMEDILILKHNNNSEINNNSDIKYNTYLFYKSQNILLNKYNDETKLDFCLLILILLQDNFVKHNILKNRLREILIKAQNKFGEIKDNLIKIKLCHFFKFAIPKLFNIESEEKDENNSMNKISINEKNKQNISFVEIALTFLFNNLKQENNELDGDEYLFSDALRNEVSEIIIYLCKYTQEENNILNSGINFLFQNEFVSLLPLIENIQMYSFFSVIEQIIKNVKIIDRNNIFTCLEKLTKRFQEEFQKGDNNSQLYCPLYFSIISNSYLLIVYRKLQQ